MGKTGFTSAKGGNITRDSAPLRQKDIHSFKSQSKLKERSDLHKLKKDEQKQSRDEVVQDSTVDQEGSQDDKTAEINQKAALLAQDELSESDQQSSGSGEEQSDGSDSESSEDDTEDLLKELERIKAEKARALEEDILNRSHCSNPLNQDPSSSSGIKRRWNDDVVFKNQLTGQKQKSQRDEKEFINDQLRSSYHKQFMHKLFKQIIIY